MKVWFSVFLLSGLLTSCDSRQQECSRKDVFCVGVVTAYGGVDDHGLNQAVWEELKQKQTEIQLEVIESVDPLDWGKNIAYFAEEQYDIVITVGRGISDDTLIAARINPDISFVGIDQIFEDTNSNLSTITFPEDQAGFLAGALSAMTTNTGQVGAVCESSSLDAMWRYCEGFRAGVKHVDVNVKATVIYREDGSRDKFYNDPAWGSQVAQRLIRDGVDILFAVGGGTAEGALQTAAANDILVIGTEESSFLTQPEYQKMILSRINKDLNGVLAGIVSNTRTGNATLGAYQGGITYVPLRNLPAQKSEEIRATYENLYIAMIDGNIETNVPAKR